MNVLIVSMQRLPASGGVNTYVFDLIQSLKSKNINVDLVCQSDIDNLPVNSLKRIKDYRELLIKDSDKLPEIIFNYEVGKFAFKELLKNLDIDKYDIIHSQDGVFSKACKEVYPEKPLVATIHGSFLNEMTLLGIIRDELAVKLISRYDMWAVQCPSKVISVSSFLNNNLPNLDKEKFSVIYNGINPNDFYPTYKSNKTIKMMTSGDFLSYKGHDLLLESLIDLKRKGFKFELNMFGTGYLRSTYEEFTQQYDLPVFYKGYVSRAELVSNLQDCDIFIQPSRLENCPFSVLEAMACGCSIVCSNVGGMPEMVEHNYNGLIFNNEDVMGLSKSLEELIENSAKRDMMRRNSRKRAENLFSIEQMVDKTINIYKSVI